MNTDDPRLLLLSRADLCWCRHLNLRSGVTNRSVCKVCGKLVAIISLELFETRACICTEPPLENLFYFCGRCKGYILAASGQPYPEAYLAVRRAVDLSYIHNAAE